MEITYKEFIDNIIESRWRHRCIEEYHEVHRCLGKRNKAGGYQWKYLYDQTCKDGTIIPGAITLGLITEEEALKQLSEQKAKISS